MQDISGSVGRGGDNRPQDVRLIQQLLNKQWITGEPSTNAEVNGVMGGETISRIEAFQSRILQMSHPDGRIDPGGATFNALLSGAVGDTTGSRSLSAKGSALLKSIETLATKPYDDQTGNVIDHWVKGATIGYGHLILQDEWENYRHGISEEQASALFEADLQPFVNTVGSSVKVALAQNQFDALVILTFNIGETNFVGSSVLKLINDPAANTPYSGLEQAWKAWNRSQGRENAGLNNRRQAEWKIFSEAVYEKW